MATNFHSQLQQQQPAAVQIVIGQAGQVLHSGMWRLDHPPAECRPTGDFDHSEQLLIDQACLSAFQQVEPEFDRRPVEVAYRADFASRKAASEFVGWMQRFDEYEVWCQQDGRHVLVGFMAPLDEEALLQASLVVHSAIATAKGVLAGWGLKEDGRSWMTVVRAELEVPSTLH